MENQGQPVGGAADPTIDEAPIVETDSMEGIHTIILPQERYPPS